jgi:hypothetical protein
MLAPIFLERPGAAPWCSLLLLLVLLVQRPPLLQEVVQERPLLGRLPQLRRHSHCPHSISKCPVRCLHGPSTWCPGLSDRVERLFGGTGGL